MQHDEKRIGRRKALVASALGAAALGGTLGCTSAQKPEKEPTMSHAPSSRMPVVYLPHGGGPWPFVELGFPRAELEPLAAYLRGLSAITKAKPKALLVISAHWEAPVATVSTSLSPPMLYDYYGFPPESYALQWPAKGDPQLAARVRALLGGAGFDTAADPARGFDHGTFVPLKLSYPEADIPTVQLSLKAGLDPAEHIAMGRALQPLRDEGVFIVGSGMSFHNMRAFFNRGADRSQSQLFDRWLRETAEAPANERDQRLTAWASAPGARFAHPREEHLLPLMVIAGAASEDRGSVPFRGASFGHSISAIHFG
jgi:aromatic ring-opening dioxygenase catalytic subunit (LigB family)